MWFKEINCDFIPNMWFLEIISDFIPNMWFLEINSAFIPDIWLVEIYFAVIPGFWLVEKNLKTGLLFFAEKKIFVIFLRSDGHQNLAQSLSSDWW